MVDEPRQDPEPPEPLNRRARQAFPEGRGAGVAATFSAGGLTRDELERVLRRYPGDP